MLGDHRGVVVAATCQMRDQVFVRKFLGVDRLELSVSLERGRLDLFIPVVKLLSPELPLEDIFDTLEALRYVAFRDRPHRLVREAVDVLVLERVDKHPIKACEVLNTAPQCLGMELCPVTRHGSRKVDRIEFPRARAGRFEAKLHCLPSPCCSLDFLLAVKSGPGNSGGDTDIAEGPILISVPHGCLLLAQSGHHNRAEPCPLLGVKRTSGEHASMSAIDPKRTCHGYSSFAR